MEQISEITEEATTNHNEPLLQLSHKQKSSNQFRALFFKTATLQSKQIGTNLCQILTPIICLLFTFIIKVIVQANVHMDDQQYSTSIPLPLNVQIPEQFDDRIKLNCLQWYQYSLEDPNINRSFVGLNPGEDFARSGFLGNTKIVNRNCSFVYDKIQDYNLTTPFFRENNNTEGLMPDLAERLDYLRNVSVKTGLAALPDGAVRFHQISQQKLNATILINDVRTIDYHRTSGVTAIKLRPNESVSYTFVLIVPQGQLTLVDLLNSAYVKKVFNKIINTVLIYFPITSNEQVLISNLINMVASTIFPVSLSLLLPVFLYAIVLQKEEKLIQMMRMNGMKMRYYWLVNFIFNLILSFITATVFYIFGRFVLKNSFFTDTNFFLQFLVLLGWMLAQIGMATLFQTFISHSNSANIIGYLLSIWTSMIAASLNLGLYQYPQKFPYALKMYAPFAFNRILYVILSKCSMDSCPTSMSGLDQQIIQCLVYMYLNFVIFQFLGMYLYEVIPQQFGVARSPLYMIKDLIKKIKRQNYTNSQTEDDQNRFNYMKLDDEDTESISEREKVRTIRPQQIRNYPLVVNNIRKLYNKEGRAEPYPAVRSFNLTVGHNQIFGLLGPNGAGKTTLISIITGMFAPNNGNAWVGGHSIKEELEKVHLEMGVCPQFDLLWPMLTVQEHLLFYARLKGIKASQEKQKVSQALEQVNLTEFRTFKARQLSGGMKRRLSVAISLVGDPQIVFMDEPTTGLDPENRRDLWSVLIKCRLKRSVFLTTHMMDEADTLCNRIGIITSGVLRTIGNQIMLRNKYGRGYKLDINLGHQEKQLKTNQVNLNINQQLEQFERDRFEQSKMTQSDNLDDENEVQMSNPHEEELKEFMKHQFPQSVLIKKFNNNFSFGLGQNYLVSEVFLKLQKNKSKLGIKNWGIINSSLEDVFLEVVSKFDSETLKELQND